MVDDKSCMEGSLKCSLSDIPCLVLLQTLELPSQEDKNFAGSTRIKDKKILQDFHLPIH